MRQLIVQSFVTLDGVMQAPGGPGEDDDGGFAHGGWSVNYWDDQMGEVMGEATSRPFAMVLGRRTYDIMAAHSVFRSMIIGVDRLDYSKGLEERFVGFERFLHDYPVFNHAGKEHSAPTQRGDVWPILLNHDFAAAREFSHSDASGTHLGHDSRVSHGVDVAGAAAGGVEKDQTDRHQDRESQNDDVACSFESS